MSGRSVAFAFALLALASAPCSGAGTARAAPAGTEPPARAADADHELPTLGERNAVTQAADALRAELDALAKSGTPGAVRDARIAFRRIAYDLLFRGGSAAADRQAMAVAGMRLAELGPMIDEAVATPAPAGVDADAVQDALRRFAEGAEHGLPAGIPADAPERGLAPAMAPLREALVRLAGAVAPLRGPAWPTAAALDALHGDQAGDAPRDAAPARTPGEGPRGGAPVTDASRTEAAAGWPAAIAAMHGPSRTRMEAVVRRWTAMLADPRRAAEARTAMDAFALQRSIFTRLRMEDGLRRGDPAARAAAGGRGDALLAEIDRRRTAWASAWANGKGMGPPAERMLRLARTMEVIAAATAVGAAEPGERQLGRWGGFGAPAIDLGVHPKALVARSRLALEALLDGREDEAESQLVKLDAELPVAWLVARVAERLGPWLLTRGGAVAALDAAIEAPGPDAWLADDRADLMCLARLAREEAFARGTRDPELAATIRRAMAGIAVRTAPGLDRVPTRLPGLVEIAVELERGGATAPRTGAPAGAAPR